MNSIDQGCQTHFHLSPGATSAFAVAFKGLNAILRLYKCNYSITVKQELGTAARQKQGGGPDQARGHCVCHFCYTFSVCDSILQIIYRRKFSFSFLKILFIYLFSKRGGGREKERERNSNVWLPLTWPPAGNVVHNPGICPDWELNQGPFGSQTCTQPTELHQPGQWQEIVLILSSMS